MRAGEELPPPLLVASALLAVRASLCPPPPWPPPSDDPCWAPQDSAPSPASLSTWAAWGSLAGSSHSRFSRKLCSGKLGIAMKVLGGVAVFWAVFILGYVTGYFVHKCK